MKRGGDLKRKKMSEVVRRCEFGWKLIKRVTVPRVNIYVLV